MQGLGERTNSKTGLNGRYTCAPRHVCVAASSCTCVDVRPKNSTRRPLYSSTVQEQEQGHAHVLIRHAVIKYPLGNVVDATSLADAPCTTAADAVRIKHRRRFAEAGSAGQLGTRATVRLNVVLVRKPPWNVWSVVRYRWKRGGRGRGGFVGNCGGCWTYRWTAMCMRSREAVRTTWLMKR